MDEMFYLNFIDVSKVQSLKQNYLIRRFVYMLPGLSIETVKHITVSISFCVAFITLNILEAYLFHLPHK